MSATGAYSYCIKIGFAGSWGLGAAGQGVMEGRVFGLCMCVYGCV